MKNNKLNILRPLALSFLFCLAGGFFQAGYAVEPVQTTAMPLRTFDSTAIKLNTIDKAALTTEPATTAETSTTTDTVKVPETIKPVVINPDILKRTIQAANDRKDNGKGWGVKIQSMFSEYWVQMLALIVSVVGLFLAVSGFSLANKKKRKYLKKFLHEIDDVYASYKWKSKRCEAELYRLEDQIEDRLKAGKIDENTYHLLEGRIKKYLDEMKESDQAPSKP